MIEGAKKRNIIEGYTTIQRSIKLFDLASISWDLIKSWLIY